MYMYESSQLIMSSFKDKALRTNLINKYTKRDKIRFTESEFAVSVYLETSLRRKESVYLDMSLRRKEAVYLDMSLRRKEAETKLHMLEISRNVSLSLKGGSLQRNVEIASSTKLKEQPGGTLQRNVEVASSTKRKEQTGEVRPGGQYKRNSNISTDGTLHRNVEIASSTKLKEQHGEVLPGGQYKPYSDISTGHMALLVPYRNRESQLQTFLKHIHPFLRNQSLNYRIFIIEMAQNITFNRGALFNIGFKEANKLKTFDCFIFHDVDLLPEDNRNVYTCARMPRHLSAAIDKFEYSLLYKNIVGGALAMSTRQFQEINGFSNMFFGWGGEDDDLYRRICTLF